MMKVSSTYLNNRLEIRQLMGVTKGSTMDLFVMLPLEEEVSVSEAKLHEYDYLLYRHVGPL